MTEQNSTPARAYDMLEQFERNAVDEYVKYAINQAHIRRVRIAHMLDEHIPSEHVRRSKGVLAKPLARAAVAEKLQDAADEEDVSPDRVIREHSLIAFSNIADFIDIRPFGDFSVKPLDKIPRELLQSVKSMKTIPSPYGIRTEITLHDKQQSLKVLTELVGLVAPDQPPVLKKYLGLNDAKTKQVLNAVPETAYQQLLEQSSPCRT